MSHKDTLFALTKIKHKDTMPELGPLFEYYKLLLQEQMKFEFHPNIKIPDIELCQKRISKGLPALGTENIKIDWELFDDLFERVSKITRQRKKGGNNSSPKISNKSKDWHNLLLKGLLEEEDCLDLCAKQIDLDIETFVFLAYRSITPFLCTYAEKLKKHIDNSAWVKGYCLICGGEPLMGKLDIEAGKKFLQCYLCKTEWSFKRLECYLCGNNHQDKLRFFYDHENPFYRVEVCDMCKTYLKVIDNRKIMEVDNDIFVANLSTIHLDIVAKSEGFFRETNKLFGL